MKIYVICGHGAGDSGAVGNGFQEAERVRTLGARLKALGGDNVILADINRNFYKDNGISNLDIPKDYQIIELHMDSASATARGAHVIISSQTSADAYDIDLSVCLSRLFPGRADIIVKRDNLANPSRAYAMGYAYRLVEIGFISNADDVAIFNANIDNIAKGILECFGFGTTSNPVPTPQPTPEAPKPTPASGQVLHLPQSATSWNVYPTNVAPVTANSCGKLNPSLVSGGLKYDIIGNPQTDVVTIKTRDFGTVNIYVAASTGATITKGSGATNTVVPTPSKEKVLYLPATATSWNVYPTNKAPVVANSCGKLNPSLFGGLKYEILGRPQTDVVTIQTSDFGKVNIYVGAGTGAVIK